MKRLRTLFVTVILAIATFTLSACGGSAEPDENSGVYEGVSAKAFGLEMAIGELYAGGISIELMDGGKAVFTLEGKDYKMKWSHEGKDFRATGGGAELFGTVEDGVLLLSDLMGSGVDIRLECKTLMKKKPVSGGDATGAAEDAGQPISGRYEAIAGETGAEDADVSGYDFETALEYVGDWHGICVMAEGAHYLGEDFSNVKITAFARMVIDEEGEPQVWFRHTNDDQMNFTYSVALFDEDGWMTAGGMLGETEWYAEVDPPDPDTGMIRFRGETQDGEELFTMYLKQFGQLWEAGDLPQDQFDDALLPLYNQIAILPVGQTVKEFLTEFTRDFKPLHEGTTRNVLNSEMPANDLLELYR